MYDAWARGNPYRAAHAVSVLAQNGPEHRQPIRGLFVVFPRDHDRQDQHTPQHLHGWRTSIASRGWGRCVVARRPAQAVPARTKSRMGEEVQGSYFSKRIAPGVRAFLEGVIAGCCGGFKQGVKKWR